MASLLLKENKVSILFYVERQNDWRCNDKYLGII